MQYKDFASKRQYRKTIKRSKQPIKFLRYIIGLLCLGLLLLWQPRLFDFIAKFDLLYLAKPPQSWLFVNVKNNQVIDVNQDSFNQLGLRWVKRCSRASCLGVFNKLQQTDLPISLVSVPNKGLGVCRIELGPYQNNYQVFVGMDQLFSLGFYGKVSIISWLGL